MKKLLQIVFLSLLVTLSVAEGRAQTNVYHPFPDSDGVWSEYYNDQNSSTSGYYLYSIFGDTTINSLKYHKVYFYSENKYSTSDTIITKDNSTLIKRIPRPSGSWQNV